MSEKNESLPAAVASPPPCHTPGPWEWNTFTKFDDTPIQSSQDVADTLALSALKSDVAELWGVSLPGHGQPVVCYTGNGPTSGANARLIAAAPDLLDALKELADLMDDVRTGSYKPESFTNQPARMAIAKAEGKS